jgi:hypothetical protein
MKTDYTQMTAGTKVDRGEIQICPSCGRLGLTKEINEVIFVTHSAWLTPNGKGELEGGEDECIIQPSKPEEARD